ncbi:hypothetical protein C8R45DRAFT_11830 [Mycena sanguinolenta]|nr:hypothetical protein C8R45DRAFT_11830 [Mycena sanguinolenta]
MAAATANARAHLKAVITAVTVHVQSSGYSSPSLPIIPSQHWTSILDQSNDNKLLFEERLAAGEEVLNFALFTLVGEMQLFHGRPLAFTQITRDAISSRQVLKEILLKTDPELRHFGIEQLESGFHYLVGYLWGRASEEIKYLMPTLRPLFEPLLQVAAAAYDAYPRGLRPATIERLEDRENTRKSEVVAFLKHVKEYQAPHSQTIYHSPSQYVEAPMISHFPPVVRMSSQRNISSDDIPL